MSAPVPNAPTLESDGQLPSRNVLPPSISPEASTSSGQVVDVSEPSADAPSSGSGNASIILFDRDGKELGRFAPGTTLFDILIDPDVNANDVGNFIQGRADKIKYKNNKVTIPNGEYTLVLPELEAAIAGKSGPRTIARAAQAAAVNAGPPPNYQWLHPHFIITNNGRTIRNSAEPGEGTSTCWFDCQWQNKSDYECTVRVSGIRNIWNRHYPRFGLMDKLKAQQMIYTYQQLEWDPRLFRDVVRKYNGLHCLGDSNGCGVGFRFETGDIWDEGVKHGAKSWSQKAGIIKESNPKIILEGQPGIKINNSGMLEPVPAPLDTISYHGGWTIFCEKEAYERRVGIRNFIRESEMERKFPLPPVQPIDPNIVWTPHGTPTQLPTFYFGIKLIASIQTPRLEIYVNFIKLGEIEIRNIFMKNERVDFSMTLEGGVTVDMLSCTSMPDGLTSQEMIQLQQQILQEVELSQANTTARVAQMTPIILQEWEIQKQVHKRIIDKEDGADGCCTVQ